VSCAEHQGAHAQAARAYARTECKLPALLAWLGVRYMPYFEGKLAAVRM
jgi:hypothetical protein